MFLELIISVTVVTIHQQPQWHEFPCRERTSDKRVVGRQCGAYSFGWAAPFHVVSCCDQTVAPVIDAIQESGGHSADCTETYGCFLLMCLEIPRTSPVRARVMFEC